MAALYTTTIALGLGLGMLLTACGGARDGDGDGGTIDTISTSQEPKDTEVIQLGGKVFSIPSPVQAAVAIRKAGLKYRKDLTASLEAGAALTGNSAQAAALGVYGADLAYVTVHQDGQRALATLQAIEKLSAKLDLGNAFDRSLVDRFKSNLGSEDSLLRFSGTAFRAADQYLKGNERDDVSALVLAGGWVESLHLTLSDPAALNDQALIGRIGDQKATLDGLVELLETHVTDPAAAGLIKGLRELRVHFDGVDRTYEYAEPVTNAAARTTHINSKSTVNIPPAKLEAIVAQVRAIRSLILA